MKRILSVGTGAGIVIFWAVMMGLLVWRQMVQPLWAFGERLQLQQPSSISIREDWKGIYFKDQKIGYSLSRMNPYSAGGFKGYHLENNTLLVVKLLGQRCRVRLKASMISDENYDPSSFDFSLDSGIHEIRVEGEFIGDKVVVNFHTGGSVITREIDASEGALISNSFTPFLALPRLTPGAEYTVNILDPFSLNTAPAKITVSGPMKYEFKGEVKEVMLIHTEYQGISLDAYVTEEGEVLREETPLGWTLVKESRKEALEFEAMGSHVPVDLVKMISIPSDVQIPSPEELKSMKVGLGGIDPERFDIESNRQRIESLSPFVVEVRASAPAQHVSISELPALPGYAGLISPTPLVQSDDPRIRNLAERISAGETDAWEAAKKLNRWVYRNISKIPNVSVPSATEIYEKMEGDCNEHTTFYAALARSVGIPVRMAVGIVYYHGNFGYHAWPEVYVGEWVSMDPTFGQDVADATHVRLITGDLSEQARMAAVIGRLGVSVLEYD